jgi:hypothetical protein
VRGSAAFSAFSLLAFLVDTASERLAKRFGGQACLGPGKTNMNHERPENEFSSGKSEKAKTTKGKLS